MHAPRSPLLRRGPSLAPTRFGWACLGASTALLAVAVIYNNNLCHLLAFAAFSLTAVSVPATLAHGRALRVLAARCDPTFAGGEAEYRLSLRLERGAPADVGLAFVHGGHAVREARPGRAARFTVRVPAPRRGRLEPGPALVMTEFPLGLFRASLRLRVPPCLVYPRPLPGRRARAQSPDKGASPRPSGPGAEDYRDLAAYRRGDPLSRIAWKASARGQGLRTKIFDDLSDEAPIFDWHALDGDVEYRLSRLCRMVLDASRLGQAFGLRLPGLEVPVSSGEGHRNAALTALALYGLPDAQPGAGHD